MHFSGLKNDLMWIASCPPLLSTACNIPLVDEFWRQQIFRSIPHSSSSQNRAAQLEENSYSNLTLGRYFEQLIFECLKMNSECEIITTNLSVHGTENTLGEVDLIFRHKPTSTLHHWELAFKYYLQKESDTNITGFMGPGARDTLQRKMLHIKQKQLPLIAQKETKDLLKKLFSISAETIDSRLLMLGQLFYHGFSTHRAVPVPNGINSSHKQGWWVRESELTELETAPSETLWFIFNIKKRDQRARLTCPEGETLLTLAELIDFLKKHFNEKETSLLVASCQENETGVFETSRGFIVPRNWPSSSARPSLL